jgi:serine/threonine-protein kinase HipA
MKGVVYYNDKRCGVVEQTDEGYQFQYDADYTSVSNSKPISQTLPLRSDAYKSKTMFPFFDGLIPEGWLLDVAVETWKINPRDRMTLLLTVCKDCIGAVKVIKQD